MICPVEIAHEMSALRAVRMEDHAEHESLSEGRNGAGDEDTERDVAGEWRRRSPGGRRLRFWALLTSL